MLLLLGGKFMRQEDYPLVTDLDETLGRFSGQLLSQTIGRAGFKGSSINPTYQAKAST